MHVLRLLLRIRLRKTMAKPHSVTSRGLLEFTAKAPLLAKDARNGAPSTGHLVVLGREGFLIRLGRTLQHRKRKSSVAASPMGMPRLRIHALRGRWSTKRPTIQSMSEEPEGHSHALEPSLVSDPDEIARSEARNGVRQFDAVTEMIEHFSDPERWLPHFSRLLREVGLLT